MELDVDSVQSAPSLIAFCCWAAESPIENVHQNYSFGDSSSLLILRSWPRTSEGHCSSAQMLALFVRIVQSRLERASPPSRYHHQGRLDPVFFWANCVTCAKAAKRWCSAPCSCCWGNSAPRSLRSTCSAGAPFHFQQLLSPASSDLGSINWRQGWWTTVSWPAAFV